MIISGFQASTGPLGGEDQAYTYLVIDSLPTLDMQMAECHASANGIRGLSTQVYTGCTASL